MQDVSLDAVTSPMFRRLFNYISGQNDKSQKIAMTAPVSVLIEPGSGPNCESTFSMAFYIPPALQAQPPQPTGAEVSIEERPEFKVFARYNNKSEGTIKCRNWAVKIMQVITPWEKWWNDLNYAVCFCDRGFEGPVDEAALVEQARIFGELLITNKEKGVIFDAYFSVNYFPLGNCKEEVWFVKSE